MDIVGSAPIGNVWDTIGDFFMWLKGPVEIILTVASILAIAIVFHFLFKIRVQNSIEYHKYKPMHIEKKEQGEHSAEWDVIIDHVNSNRPAEWKIAILEADNMLDELVKRVGYEGETLGERLKAIDPSEFATLEGAWEAHKIRNQIAHSGTDFQLTEREVRRVINLYERVFKEFNFI